MMGVITRSPKGSRSTGLERLHELAAEPPPELVEARGRLADARQRERDAQEVLDRANALDESNPVRRRLVQSDAAADVYDARTARKHAENEAQEVAQRVWRDHLRNEMMISFAPILQELDGKLREAQASNDRVREAEALLRKARPKELVGTGVDFNAGWSEFGHGDESRLTSWRKFVHQEFDVEL